MISLRIFIFVSIITLMISCSSGKTIDREKFDKVEIGMKISEVKHVLGEPDVVKYSEIDSTVSYFYLTENDALNKKYASVYFDRSGYVSFLAFANPS